MSNKRISVVKSLYNPDISDGLLIGMKNYLDKNNFEDFKSIIEVFNVPGAFEIPGAVKQLLNKKNSLCIICLGSVIKGETAHFEYISKAVTEGITKLTLQSEIPIIFGVLTAYNYKQALSRASLKGKNKGAEIMEAAILTMKTYKQINC